jgi:alkylation response protein AidB-like acyl-CoA dehydrogenase
MVELAKANGKIGDAATRQALMKLRTLNELGRFNNLRLKAAKQAGKDIPGLPNIAKLSMSEIVRQSRDIGLGVVGAYGTLHAYGADDRKALDAATGNPFLGMITELSLFAQAPPIYGGTDQVQRNIIGERVLGLPKEPGDNKALPYKDLPKNG